MIQMIAGVYGLRVEAGKDANGKPKYRVKGMGPEDGPFSVTPEKEKRLVKLGLARYVNEIPTESADNDEIVDGTPVGFDETPPADTEDEDAPKPLEELSRDELREVCKEYGLPYKATDSKAKLIEKITEFQNSAEDTEDEDAPVFDAAEAVQ